MGFLKVLGSVLHAGVDAAPTVATAINPAAGALVGLVVHSVTQAEQAGGTGVQKKAQVMQDVLPAATGVVNAALQARNVNTQLNSTQISTAVGSMVDSVVALMNSVQADPAATTPASAAKTAGS